MIVLNAVFASAEIAVLSINEAKLERMAMVIDEYGGMVGIVTLHDSHQSCCRASD